MGQTVSNGTFETASAVSIPNAITTPVYDVVLGGHSSGHIVNMELECVGAGTIAFSVQLKDHKNGAWYNYLTATDFDSTTNSNMLFSSPAPAPKAVATGQKANATIRINGAYAMRINGLISVGTGSAKVRGSVKSA